MLIPSPLTSPIQECMNEFKEVAFISITEMTQVGSLSVEIMADLVGRILEILYWRHLQSMSQDISKHGMEIPCRGVTQALAVGRTETNLCSSGLKSRS